MNKTEQLQIIIASYFKYWGDEVAEMLEAFEEIEAEMKRMDDAEEEKKQSKI